MGLYTKKDQKVKMLSGDVFVGKASAGSWSRAVASGVISYNKVAGDNAPVFEIALSDYFAQDELVGTTVDKVVVHYNVTEANITTTAAEFHVGTYNATTNVPSVATIAATGTLTKTKDATYAIEITPNSTITVDQDSLVQLELTLSGAATTVIKLYGLDIYYTPAGE